MQIPKNVVQAGDVDSCHKIYIEDYVHTYLSQCRDTDSQSDFCLYGKTEKEGDVRYYFVYGAAKEGPGWEITARRYFAKQSRIGEVTFDDKEAWLFFEDGYAAPLEGYFIFYEQNEDMQSYLIAVHQNQPGETVQEVVPRAASRSFEKGGRGGQVRGMGQARGIGQARENGQTHEDRQAYENRQAREMGQAREKGPASEAEAGAEKEPEAREPRRILRVPRNYDIDTMQTQDEDAEKIMQAAEVTGGKQPGTGTFERRRPDSRHIPSGKYRNRNQAGSVQGKPAGSSSSFLSRAAGLVILLVLCGIGVTSINRYNDMKEAGNLFADAARQQETETEENTSADSGFQIEEKQAGLPDSGDAAQASGSGVSGQASADIPGTPSADSASAAGPQAADKAAADPSSIDTSVLQDGSAQAADGQAAENQTGEPQQAGTLPVISSDIDNSSQGGQAAADIPASESTLPSDDSKAADIAPDAGNASASEQQPPDEEKDTTKPASNITSEAVAASAPVPSSYTVKKGDNLANICRRFYGNLDKMDEICELNSISNPNRLVAGQKIILPK